MRWEFLVMMAVVAVCTAAPQLQLQKGSQDTGSQPFIDEVVVESVLQVRTPQTGRQARTNTHTSLQDGASVATETKNRV